MALSFVADENVESDVVVALRGLGHDVVDVAHTRVTSLISLTRKHARHSATRRRSAISGTRAKAAWTGQARATGAVSDLARTTQPRVQQVPQRIAEHLIYSGPSWCPALSGRGCA